MPSREPQHNPLEGVVVSTVPLRLRRAGKCVPASSAKGEETARLLNNCGTSRRRRAAEAPRMREPAGPELAWTSQLRVRLWGRSLLLLWHAWFWTPVPSAAGTGEE